MKILSAFLDLVLVLAFGFLIVHCTGCVVPPGLDLGQTQGPQGPQGAPGSRGPQGAPGQPGTCAPPRVVYATHERTAVAQCPEGSFALSGGCLWTEGTEVYAGSSVPVTDPEGRPRGWLCDAAAAPGVSFQVTAEALCSQEED